MSWFRRVFGSQPANHATRSEVPIAAPSAPTTGAKEASAESFVLSDRKYDVLEPTVPRFEHKVEHGEVTIVKYLGGGCSGRHTYWGDGRWESSDGLIVDVPGTIDGFPVTTIGSGAFQSCGHLISVALPASVTTLGREAFRACHELLSVAIPPKVRAIPTMLFFDCGSLRDVSLPDTITAIGYRAFEGCASLGSVRIPTGVVSIEHQAFNGCNSLRRMMIPPNVTDIGEYVFWCNNLEEIAVDANNPVFTSIDGVLYSKDMATLLQYPRGKRDASFTIPNGVAAIGKGAFFACRQLTTISLSDAITHILSRQFECCDALTEVTIGGSVTNIGEGAFSNLSSLKKVFFRGDPPSFDVQIFGACEPTVFYLPTATGWGATYASRPTALWAP